jgi:hypothetical protein
VQKNQAVGKINDKALCPASALDAAFHFKQVPPAMSLKK